MTKRIKTKRTFATVPLTLIADRRLGLRQLRTLLALFVHWNPKRTENKNQVWPARRTITRWTGYSESKISTLTTELEKLGWLEKKGNGGMSRAVRYTLNPEMVGTEASIFLEAITGQDDEGRGPDDNEDREDDSSYEGDSSGDSGVTDNGTQESSNREPNGAQNEDGQRTHDEVRKKKREESCARDKLARSLVNDFLSIFSGLGHGVPQRYSAHKYKGWSEDFLQLIDDGVDLNLFGPLYKWLLERNPLRQFPFCITTPTDLREKWLKVFAAAGKDLGWAFSLDEPPAVIRAVSQINYIRAILPTVVKDDLGQCSYEDELSVLLDILAAGCLRRVKIGRACGVSEDELMSFIANGGTKSPIRR